MATEHLTKFDPIGAALYTLPLNDRQYHAACSAYRMLRDMGSRACGDSCLAVERGPERPAIIAHRYWCPSCDAQPGEPCRLSEKFTQEYSHVSRHRVAQRALWQRMQWEIENGFGYIDSLGIVR